MQNALTSSTADPQSAVLLCVDKHIAKASSYFDYPLRKPQVTFRASGTRAGTAFLHQNRVNFHRILLQHNLHTYLSDVVPHEIAHLVVHSLFGRVQPHGREWKLVMQSVFGCRPSVTHTLDLSVLERKTWDYQCACTTHQLTTRRHNAIQQKKRIYRCQRCENILTVSP
ncbi:SprT family zinc-dependent metalloprotease [Alteromonas sediminis]|nr:SprT family zinc-dependent metalloprotease [Alteromonas sediminis]